MNNFHRMKPVAMAILLATSPFAIAQEETPELEEVVVVGVKASLRKAVDLKRNSVGVVDGIVAEDMAKFPDLNLGEALQRITGVTVERADGGSRTTAIGEGSSINVRGLGPQFTRTEINGMTGTNTGQDRGFGFNLLASELFTQAQVTKSLSAKDNEGGLAGTVKLQTYRPLDYADTKVVVNGNVNFSEVSDDFDPKFSVNYVDQLNDGKFGVALGFAYQDSHRVENIADASNWDFLRDSLRGNFDLLSATEQAEISDLLIPRDPRILVNDRDSERINLSATFQYQPSESLLVTFDNIVASIDQTGDQVRQDFPIEGFPGTFVPENLVRDGDRFVSGTFPAASHFARVLAYDYDIQEELTQHVLSAEWQATDNLLVKPHIGYSASEQDLRKWNVVDFRTDNTDITYAVQGDFVTFDAAIGNISDPALFGNLRDIRDRPQLSQDEEISAKIDFEYLLQDTGFTSLDFGLRYSEREKSFASFDGRADRNVIRNLGLNLASFADVRDFNVDGQPANYPTQIIGVNFSALEAAVPGGFGFDRNERTQAGYQVNEDTIGVYLQGNFEFGRLLGNVGLRYIDTDQVSLGVQVVTSAEGVSTQVPARFENSYDDVLPSLTLKYDISDTFVLRGAAYKSLSRPDLVDIQPARNFGNFNGANGNSGNPELNPFTSDNFEISAEWYFSEDGLFSVGYFDKSLNGLIERVTEEVQLQDPFTNELLSINLSRPINGDGASVDGLEVSFQTSLSFISESLENFGMVLNYTSTDSTATFQNVNDVRTSSLPGLSDSSYNAILYYDDEKFSVRGAYNWRSDYLLQVSGSGGQPVYRDDYGQLDLSASYTLNDQWNLKLDVINVLGDQARSYSSDDRAKIKGLIETGYQVIFGASYQF